MKLKTILIAGLIIILVGSCNSYLNLLVSEKYETQLEGLGPTEQQIKEAKELKKKIDLEKKITIAVALISLALFYPVSLMKSKSK
ncbi:hypothetical protein LZQ00_12290 [Sphingobacterium sp. SRCM116780]|uniref:hypothetical protein n=1 Tax=Sphingobacterium sp. SRCM116780 TaxID=2907623 RepID=UPI001F4587AD|nr:hypothetical protein [Sphingobacterium sp. SRCM116780]UIR55058.1 hypothetical protein LZQ00_12290 [Sphingobacterium sp. SRCM116780]